MEFFLKKFTELSAEEVYNMLKLRSAVFVKEQHCAYLDMDDLDQQAWHVLLLENDQLIGYSRILAPHTVYPQPAIGRVVLDQTYRRNGLGRSLMQYSIKQSLQLYNNQGIVISAQKYLLKFYSDLGFMAQGEEYLEDDIPHIKMIYSEKINK